MARGRANSRPPFGMGGRPVGLTVKAQNFRHSFGKLLRFLRRYIPALILVAFLSIGATLLAISGPMILAGVTDELNMAVKQGRGVDLSMVKRTILFLITIYMISSIFSYFLQFIMAIITQRIGYRLRQAVSRKLNVLPLSYFDQKTHGEILSIVTNDIDTIASNLNSVMTQVISSLILLIGVVVMMLMISWQLSIVTLLIVPISLIAVTIVIKKSQKYFVRQLSDLGRLNGHIEEMISGHQVIKAFNAEEQSIREFMECNYQFYDSSWRAQYISSRMYPIIGFIGNISFVANCLFGAFLATVTPLTIGGIIAFITYAKQFNMPLTQTANIANVIQTIVAAWERVLEFLEQDEEQETGRATPRLIEGEVEFKNVSFGYLPDTIIINDFSALIGKGQKVAIVGPTGAGKTTIVKLLMRFYPLNGGMITLDGVDINDITKEELHKALGMVLQDTWLFHGTIMENIRFGRLDATDEEVIEAARAAKADDFIRTLPGGYQLVIDENGSNIAHGQKQLLTIARALLANPKVLILDEATSSVDTRTEVLIQEAMETLMKGRTNFVIAHRLSTIRNADLILVMNEGDIIEQGTHLELLKKGGAYASLHTSQFDVIE